MVEISTFPILIPSTQFVATNTDVQFMHIIKTRHHVIFVVVYE